jgi:PAS domain S-box-containing protein
MNRIPVQFKIALGLLLPLISSMGLAVVLGISNMKMILLVAGVSFISFMFFIKRMLRYRDSSEVAPAHVRAAVDTLAEGLLIMDRDGQIALANRAFGNVVGRQPETLIGQSASSLPWQTQTANGSVNAPTLPWHRAIASNQPLYNTTLLLADSSGVTRTFTVNCSPVVGAGGKVRGALASFEDVTSLVQKEIEVRQSKEAAGEAKSELLARMGDEIRTPMKAILCFMDYLRRRYDEDDKERHEFLNTIQSSSQQLNELINDIHDGPRIESGKLDLMLRRFAGYAGELPNAEALILSSAPAEAAPKAEVQAASAMQAPAEEGQTVPPAEAEIPHTTKVQAVPSPQAHEEPTTPAPNSLAVPAEPPKTSQVTNAIPARLHTTLSTDDPDYLELVQDFVDRLQDQLGKMQDAWDERELGELARLAHWLKGSGDTHGFPMFTGPAATLEKLANEKRIEDINAALADVCDLGRRVTRPKAKRRKAAKQAKAPAAKAQTVLAAQAQTLGGTKVRAVLTARTHKEPAATRHFAPVATKSNARAVSKRAKTGQVKKAKPSKLHSAVPKRRKAIKPGILKKPTKKKQIKGMNAAPKAKRRKAKKRGKK